MNILNLLQGTAGTAVINNITKRLGVQNSQVRMAIAVGLPLLITALRKNAEKDEGANGILGAVNKKHDGGILDNITDLFDGDDGDEDEDGSKILNHVLGNNKDQVANSISKESGLSSQKVVGILSMLAPIVMGMVGKNAKNNNTDAGGLSGLIGGLLGGLDGDQRAQPAMGFIESLLSGNQEEEKPQGKDAISALMDTLF